MARYERKFSIGEGDETRSVTLAGRFAWCLEKLVTAGERGITAIDEIGPRLSHYIFVLRRRHGLTIETRDEKHGGQFSGWHGRYVLRTKATLVAGNETAPARND
jgi:Winged helix domain